MHPDLLYDATMRRFGERLAAAQRHRAQAADAADEAEPAGRATAGMAWLTRLDRCVAEPPAGRAATRVG